MSAAGFKMVGLLQQQGCDERNDQHGAQEIEGVAEGEDKGLLLHDVADRDHCALRRVGGNVQTPKGWSLVSFGLALISDFASRTNPALRASASCENHSN